MGLQPIEDCGINYSLQSHFALEEVLHLMPENVVLSGDDRIPGVSEIGAETGDFPFLPHNIIFFEVFVFDYLLMVEIKQNYAPWLYISRSLGNVACTLPTQDSFIKNSFIFIEPPSILYLGL